MPRIQECIIYGKIRKVFSQKKTRMSKTEVLAFGQIKALCPPTTEGLVEVSEMLTPLWPHCLFKIPPRYYHICKPFWIMEGLHSHHWRYWWYLRKRWKRYFKLSQASAIHKNRIYKQGNLPRLFQPHRCRTLLGAYSSPNEQIKKCPPANPKSIQGSFKGFFINIKPSFPSREYKLYQYRHKVATIVSPPIREATADLGPCFPSNLFSCTWTHEG